MAGKMVNRKTDVVAFWILNVALVIQIISIIAINLANALEGYEIMKDLSGQIIGILPWIVLSFHLMFHNRMKKDILLVLVFLMQILSYVIGVIGQISVLKDISGFFDKPIWFDFSISGRYYLLIVRDCLMVLVCFIILINILLKNNEKSGAQIPFYILTIDKLIFGCLMFLVCVEAIVAGEGLWIVLYSANLLGVLALLFLDIAIIVHIAGRRREKLRKIKETSSEERLISIKNQYEKGLINEKEYLNKKTEIINEL